MRNMSFSMTKQQYLNQTKDVTRRIGWWKLKPREICNGVEKAQGLKKGEKIVVMGQHRIVSTRIEPLNAITQEDVIREGFPEMTPEQFIAFFIKGHPKDKDGNPTTPESLVNRIEFEYLNKEIK